METSPLGRSGQRIPRIGLGGAPLGREIDEATSRDILDYALAHGISLIDTAESYGGGNAQEYRRNTLGVDDVRETTAEMHSSEKIIGRWMRDRRCRDRVIICTKFSTGGSAANVRRALQASLERLQTDYIDIYMMHMPDPKVPIRETLEALTAEVKAGKVRTIGCSNFPLSLLKEAQETAQKHGLARIESIQPPFSLASPDARNDLLPYCDKNDIAVISYSPLAAGFLTGKYTRSRDAIPKGTRFDVIPGHIDVYFSEKNFQTVDNLKKLSAESGETMSRLAMAWVFGHPGMSCVLVGARTHAHLDNAIDAAKLKLDPRVRAEMDRWVS